MQIGRVTDFPKLDETHRTRCAQCAGKYETRLNRFLVLLQVMEETNTFVTWPSRLKIGAKSKKGTLMRSYSYVSRGTFAAAPLDER